MVSKQNRSLSLFGTSVELEQQVLDKLPESLKHLEKQTQESQEMLQIVIDNIPQYIFWKDTRSIYLGCNKKFALAVGLTKTGDIQEKTDRDLFLNDNGINTYPELDHRVMETGKAKLGVVVRQSKINRKYIWLHINKIPIWDGNGKITGVLSTFEDITGHIKAEEKLKRAKEQAEKATKLKDKFVSLVAHDLRSPLANILCSLKYLDSDKACPLNIGQKEILQIALNGSESALNMVDELLNISRLRTGKIVPKRRFLDGYMLCAVAVENLKYIAARKGIEIVNQIPDELRLYADGNLIKEVLINLLSNAIKFCSRGDQVELYIQPNFNTTIVVRDTGRGISSKILPHIFKHEERTTTIGTAGEKGTGLGLPFCRDIMKAHGGSLTVGSTEGKGAVFFAKLPYVKPLILLVDNNETIRLSLKKDLLNLNADFIEAQNGIDGIKFIKKKKPHLVITDIKMPVMNGLELLHHIKKDSKTKRIPAILITSGKDMEVREMAVRMGADDFLTKPWKIHDLIPRVRRFVF